MLHNIWDHGCAWVLVNLAPHLVVSASWSRGGGPAAWLSKSSVYSCFPNFQSKKPPVYYISNDLFCLLQTQRDRIQQLGLCGVFLQCIIYLVDVFENCERKN